MIKAVVRDAVSPLLLLGLTDGNLRRLKNGQPIHIDMKAMGMDRPGRVGIIWGPTEADNLEIIDQIETQWDLLGERYTDQIEGWAALAPFVYHEGQVYELCSGQVIWRNGQWVMKRGSRRVREDDRRWPFITVPEGVE